MYRLYETLQLHPVSANILDRRSPHGTRNQGQVFQTVESRLQAAFDQSVPVVPGRNPHGDPLALFGENPHVLVALHYDQGIEVSRQHHVTALTQGQWCQSMGAGPVKRLRQIADVAHLYQRSRFGRQ